MLKEKNWFLTHEQKKGKGVVQRKKMVHDKKKWGKGDVHKGGGVIHKLRLNLNGCEWNITTKCECNSLVPVQWTNEFTSNPVKTFGVQGCIFF
jgi:hypothetical protein